MERLNYIKDCNGKYIVKNKCNNIDTSEYIVVTGNFSENILLEKKNFEKQVRHKVENCIRTIENNIRHQHRITEQDILSEKIVMEVLKEEEFNPLFNFLTLKEKQELTKTSQKIRINMEFEFHIKIKKHLQLQAFLGLLKK